MKEQPKLSARLSLLICIAALLLPAYVFGGINQDFLITVDDAEKRAGKPEWVILDKMANEIGLLKKEIAQLKKGVAEPMASIKEEEAWMNPLEESGCGLAEE